MAIRTVARIKDLVRLKLVCLNRKRTKLAIEVVVKRRGRQLPTMGRGALGISSLPFLFGGLESPWYRDVAVFDLLILSMSDLQLSE